MSNPCSIRRAVRRASLALALVGAAASPFVAPGAASAQSNTFVVDSTRDLIDVDPSDNRCDADAGTGITCTLRAAIMQANATPGQQTVRLGATVYRLTLVGANEGNSFTGDLDVQQDTVITGTTAGKAISTIDATGLGDRVFESAGAFSLRSVVVTGGFVPSEQGGAFRVRSGSLLLSDSQVHTNGSRLGGAIFGSSTSTITVQRSMINANASSTDGGGLYSEGALTILESTIKRNGANGTSANGGGILALGQLRVERSTISGNVASLGAGLAILKGEAVIDTSTISGNRATSNAGALVTHVNARLTLQHSTIARNEAPFLGGIRPSGPTRVFNTVLSGNENANCPQFTTLSGSSFNMSSDTTCQFVGTDNQVGVDPLLGPLGDNGGSTFTHALLAGSPAIDRTATSCPALDQRGVQRPQNGRCDIGAFEFAP